MDPVFDNMAAPPFDPADPGSHMGGGPAMDPAEETAGKLFIGGLSWETTQEGLKQYFERFGEIVDCVVMKDPITHRSRGFGFITFADPAKCDEVLNHPQQHVLDDRPIDPKPAVPRGNEPRFQGPRGGQGMGGYPYSGGGGGGGMYQGGVPPPLPEAPKTKKIFVGGLTPDSTVENLRDYFSQHGAVEDVILMFDRETGRPRGFGFVTFATEETVEQLCQVHFLEIGGKQVEIKPAHPKAVIDGRRAAAGGFRGGRGGGGGGGGGGGFGSPYGGYGHYNPRGYQYGYAPRGGGYADAFAANSYSSYGGNSYGNYASGRGELGFPVGYGGGYGRGGGFSTGYGDNGYGRSSYGPQFYDAGEGSFGRQEMTSFQGRMEHGRQDPAGFDATGSYGGSYDSSYNRVSGPVYDNQYTSGNFGGQSPFGNNFAPAGGLRSVYSEDGYGGYNAELGGQTFEQAQAAAIQATAPSAGTESANFPAY